MNNIKYIKTDNNIEFELQIKDQQMKGIKKQPPPQVYEDQYSEEESQPLIQQVDSAYQPTQKQVREYAIQTLGMKLPEDQNLLYLARQGLKAPIAVNWVPYQSRTGQIYYKHSITQQKIYDHPTDIEYKKKYEQFKQKAARKNLKSIALKQNMAGAGGLFSMNPISNPLAALGSIGNNSGLGGVYNLSGISGGDQMIQPSIDDEMIREWEKDLQDYEKRQQKQWRQFQQQADTDYQTKLKRIKQDHQQQLSGLKTKSNQSQQSKQLQQQKKRIQQQIQQSQQSALTQQLRLFQNQQNHKLNQYKLVFEEDKNLKINKLEQQLEQAYQEKVKGLEQKIRKLEQKKVKDRELRMQKIKEAKEELEKPNNPEIMALLHTTLQENLSDIKKQYSNKLRDRKDQLQRQLLQMKKILGVDKSQNLLVLATKKQKLMNLSAMKLTAKRNKQLQVLQSQSESLLANQKQKLKQKLALEHTEQLKQKRQQIESQLLRQKAKIEEQYNQMYSRNVEDMYQSTASERSAYESSMNKKMSELRMEYIDKITGKGKGKGDERNQNEVVNRVLIQERQKQIANKQQLVNSLYHQLQMERKQWKSLLFDQQLSTLISRGQSKQPITELLKQKLQKYNLTYSSPQLKQIKQKLTNLQNRYREDKKILVLMLRAIQETSVYNIAQMRKNMYDGEAGSGSSNGALIKKYNQDVRKMRENQEIISKFQIQVKKFQLDGTDAEAIQKLKKYASAVQYKPVALKSEMEKQGYLGDNKAGLDKRLQQYMSSQQPNSKANSENKEWMNTGSYQSPYSVEQALRQHSQFLSTVKNQLNKKLYQVRYDYRY